MTIDKPWCSFVSLCLCGIPAFFFCQNEALRSLLKLAAFR